MKTVYRKTDGKFYYDSNGHNKFIYRAEDLFKSFMVICSDYHIEETILIERLFIPREIIGIVEWWKIKGTRNSKDIIFLNHGFSHIASWFWYGFKAKDEAQWNDLDWRRVIEMKVFI